MSEKPVKLRLIFGCLVLATVVPTGRHPELLEVPTAAPLETRCGWFSNPTPANIWLYDRDGDWTIGVQGGYQVQGDWDWPYFKRGQWVKTNVNYGYGCVCLRLRVDRETREVLEIKSARARPLEVCRRDRSLKKWKHLFE